MIRKHHLATIRILLTGLLVSSLTTYAFAATSEQAQEKFDYPTAARADYVFACMATNGQTPDMLHKCACSIDVIAKGMPYDYYERAETILRMQMVEGPRSAMFKNLPWMVELADNLKRLQAQSTLECF